MKSLTGLSVFFLFLFTACQDETSSEGGALPAIQISLPKALQTFDASSARTANITVALADHMNNTLFQDKPYKVDKVWMYTTPDEVRSVETIDRQFESTLPSRWVSGDTRRNWNGDGDLTDIDYLAFSPLAIANGTIDAEPIYDAMYDKWENDGTCTSLAIDKTPYDLSMGSPSLILNFGPSLPSTGNPLADISVVGFVPASIMEAVLGSENVLGVAFSFTFIDEAGEATKSTRGKDDRAYTEIWFNDGYTWGTEPAPGVIDLESVILHEAGHSLVLGHFGILQEILEDGERVDLVYQPVNTMNALYIGEDRGFLGPNDKGNYCENWGAWPYN